MAEPEIRNLPYFAYGVHMSTSVMADRCPGAIPIGTARLDDHRFLINERGVASVVPADASVVHGALWSTNHDHIESLDSFEGLVKGNYIRTTINVAPNTVPPTSEAEPLEVLVYIACHSTPGPPRAGYLEKVIGGARDFGLPEGYIRELAGWFHATSPESERL